MFEQLDHFPMSLSLDGKELWVGDKMGFVHLLGLVDLNSSVVQVDEYFYSLI